MDIRIRMRLVNKGELVAVGDVCLDNMVILHQVKVLTLGGKTVISFPRRHQQNGWKNITTMKPELRKEIEKKVLEAVWKEAKKPLPEYKWEISVQVYYGENGLRGFASISYPGILEISGLQIKEREGKLQVVYPYGFQGNQLISLAEPADILSKDWIEQEILETYKQEISHKQEIAPAR